jgi:hypothetical protein
MNDENPHLKGMTKMEKYIERYVTHLKSLI